MLDAVIVGGGPSGLAAAYELSKHGGTAVVLERLDQVGGLSRTVPYGGCLYDIGPHRFFTKNAEVNRLFEDVVAEDLVRVQRLTRILYNDHLFNYPLTPVNALFGVGIGAAAAIIGSYAGAQFRQWLAPREPQSFEQWVSDRFGTKLFETFFKTYTEKVWGIPCSQIGADWAGQRIKGLSLATAIRNAFFKPGAKKIKTLVDEFMYPRQGAGQFYEKMARIIAERGSQVLTGRRVVRIRREGQRICSILTKNDEGKEEEIETQYLLSSAPLTETVRMMDLPPPHAVLRACDRLRYRNHIGVHLQFEGSPFPDNWIYVHDRRVQMARISNYRNFSPSMADREGISPLTVEYFCSDGDFLWKCPDEQLVELAGRDMEQAGIGRATRVLSGFVIRSKRAYPVIEIGFQDHVDLIKEWLDSLENFLPIGRSGMFKYNNQDHAIATGLLAARTVLKLGRYDPWLVNIDAEYHEAGPAHQPQQVPTLVHSDSIT